jgi:hypothetical protein
MVLNFRATLTSTHEQDDYRPLEWAALGGYVDTASLSRAIDHKPLKSELGKAILSAVNNGHTSIVKRLIARKFIQ